MAERGRGATEGNKGAPNKKINQPTGLEFPLTRLLLNEPSSCTEKKVGQLIKAKTQSYDLYNLAELTQAGLSLAQEEGKPHAIGEQILTGIATYMNFPDGFVLKESVPHTASDSLYFDKPQADMLPKLKQLSASIVQQYSEYLKHLNTRIAVKNRRKSDSELPSLRVKLNELESLSPLISIFEKIHSEPVHIKALNLIVIHSKATQMILNIAHQRRKEISEKGSDFSEQRKQAEDLEAARETRSSVLGTEMQAIIADTTLFLPDQIMDILKENADKSGGYDALKTKFGGFTLLEVLDEKDQTERIQKICSFVSHIPKGDVFWLYIARRMFFNPVLISQTDRPNNINYTLQAYLDQIRLADELFSPFVQETKIRENEIVHPLLNKQLFEPLLGSSDDKLLRWIAGSLVQVLQYGPSAIEMLDEHIKVQGFDRLGLLFSLTKDALLSSDTDARFMLIDKVMYEMMKQNKERIKKGLLTHFSQFGRQIHYFNSVLEGLLSKDYAKEHAEEIAAGLSSRIHESFWHKIEEMGPDKIDIVSNKVIKLLTSKDLQPYWPDNKSLHHISFSPTSISGVLGFQSIQFANPYTEEASPMTAKSSIQFYLKLLDSEYGLTGTIPVDFESDEIILSADFSQQPELKSLIRLIATTSFHDLISARKIAHDQSLIHGKPNQSEGNEPGNALEANSKKKKRHERSLPRGKASVLDSLTTEKDENEDIVQEGDLISIIDEHSKEINPAYKPKRIDSHATALRGAAEYKNAILEYLRMVDAGMGGEELENQCSLIQRLRLSKYSISEPKRQLVHQFPPGKVRTISDPRSGEVDYLETWVTQFWSPKPSEDELKDPNLMYKYYRIGPQMRILDMFTALLTEEADTLTP